MHRTQTKRYVLDFSNCSYIGQLYDIIIKEMELSESCGKNLSAFWDCLTGMIEVPAEIVFCRCAKNQELLSHIDALISIARRAEAEADLGISVKVQT